MLSIWWWSCFRCCDGKLWSHASFNHTFTGRCGMLGESKFMHIALQSIIYETLENEIMLRWYLRVTYILNVEYLLRKSPAMNRARMRQRFCLLYPARGWRCEFLRFARPHHRAIWSGCGDTEFSVYLLGLVVSLVFLSLFSIPPLDNESFTPGTLHWKHIN